MKINDETNISFWLHSSVKETDTEIATFDIFILLLLTEEKQLYPDQIVRKINWYAIYLLIN